MLLCLCQYHCNQLPGKTRLQNDVNHYIIYDMLLAIVETNMTGQAARDYLAQAVNPTLLKGLTELCKQKPCYPVVSIMHDQTLLIRRTVYKPVMSSLFHTVLLPSYRQLYELWLLSVPLLYHSMGQIIKSVFFVCVCIYVCMYVSVGTCLLYTSPSPRD